MTIKEKLINHIKTKGKDRSWYELALLYNIRPEGTQKERSDSARRMARRHVETNVETALFEEFLQWKRSKNTTKKRAYVPSPYLDGNEENVLVIGDLHEPFCLDSYLEFCREQQEKFNCGTVVFIGDVIDNCYSSYHDTDPDGMGAGQELDYAIQRIQDWYKVFPKAFVTIGNHDRMAYRKAFSGQLSKKWVRSLKEVLQTPNWEFVEDVEIYNVMYIHGEAGTSKNKMKHHLQSIVQGHHHTQGYIEYVAGNKNPIFGFQVGCGIDRDSYAMAYAKKGPNPIISCGVVLNKGTLPILITHDYTRQN